MTDAPTESGVESAWAKPRRRKVVQWGLVWTVAGAWGFLEGLEYVSDAFQWPAQLRQLALLAFLIGLPVILVLAWYHGDRGEQRLGGAELRWRLVLLGG